MTVSKESPPLPGGNGGGLMKVIARELLYIEGEISADGGDGKDDGGGGSGGSILLKARTL